MLQRIEGLGAGFFVHGEEVRLSLPQEAAQVCRLSSGVHLPSRYDDITHEQTHLWFLFLLNIKNTSSCFFFNPEAMAASGKTDRSPHEQEIKFFAKVRK